MMEIKEKDTKSMIEILRDIRDDLNIKIQDMNPEELKEFFGKRKTFLPERYKKLSEKNLVPGT